MATLAPDARSTLELSDATGRVASALDLEVSERDPAHRE
jgi:hypothetical protein